MFFTLFSSLPKGTNQARIATGAPLKKEVHDGPGYNIKKTFYTVIQNLTTKVCAVLDTQLPITVTSHSSIIKSALRLSMHIATHFINVV